MAVMMEYVALFYTQSGAIKYHRYLATLGIKGELKPVPRKLSSSCGISCVFRHHGDFRLLITDDVDKIYSVEADVYVLKYAAPE
jgi:hypothetical protein